MNDNTNIEYYFLKRSALRFRQDLSDIIPILNSLSEEQILGLVSYISAIKNRIQNIEGKIADKFDSFNPKKV